MPLHRHKHMNVMGMNMIKTHDKEQLLNNERLTETHLHLFLEASEDD